ncbi:hypothetical protein J7K50_02180 [bacterium]|nr:hypothetical protein [bacterium]
MSEREIFAGIDLAFSTGLVVRCGEKVIHRHCAVKGVTGNPLSVATHEIVLYGGRLVEHLFDISASITAIAVEHPLHSVPERDGQKGGNIHEWQYRSILFGAVMAGLAQVWPTASLFAVDPRSLKLHFTRDGNASKSAMIRTAVQRGWRELEQMRVTKRIREDLADAYALSCEAEGLYRQSKIVQPRLLRGVPEREAAR